MNRLEEIKARLAAATPGNWVYDSERDTHDSCIYVEGSTEEHGYIGPDNGGIIGSSEWIWVEDADGEFMAHAKADIEWMISEIERLIGENAEESR